MQYSLSLFFSLHLALGYTRDPEALKYLISRLIGQAEPMRSRAQAVYGLSHSAAWQEEPLRNQAIELLGNPHAKGIYCFVVCSHSDVTML